MKGHFLKRYSFVLMFVFCSACTNQEVAHFNKNDLLHKVDLHFREDHVLEQENRPIWNGRMASSEDQSRVFYADKDEKGKMWNFDPASVRGPYHWAHLQSSYSLCESGRFQSPIALWSHQFHRSPFVRRNAIRPTEESYSFNVVDTGRSSEIIFPQNNHVMVEVKQKLFEIKRIEIKNPSEHQWQGRFFPMELQLIYGEKDVEQGAISIFVTWGSFHSEFQKILDAYPLPYTRIGQSGSSRLKIKGFFPYKLTYVLYQGSRTSPPCSEDFEWSVLETPIQVAKEQWLQFYRRYPLVKRPIRPTGNREITEFLGF